MPYPPSPPWCWLCCRDEDDDGVKLFPVYLARPFVAASGKRTTRTIPIRVCRECVAIAIEATFRTSVRTRGPEFTRPARPGRPGHDSR